MARTVLYFILENLQNIVLLILIASERSERASTSSVQWKSEIYIREYGSTLYRITH